MRDDILIEKKIAQCSNDVISKITINNKEREREVEVQMQPDTKKNNSQKGKFSFTKRAYTKREGGEHKGEIRKQEL